MTSVDRIDLVFMVDTSSSMADKQRVLAKAVPDLVARLVNPDCVQLDEDGQVTGRARPTDASVACQEGFSREFSAIKDIHIAVVTSSLGGHGSDYCDEKNDDGVANPDDRGHAIHRRLGGGTVDTYQGAGFLAWDPDPADPASTPPGEGDLARLNADFTELVRGAGQKGCGFESSLEAWYRFLIDPSPPAQVVANADAAAAGQLATAIVEGTDEALLQQRAQFLRPDSLVAVVSLSDENDCSIIDGAMPPDVCETPTIDEKTGKVTGCQGARTAWPASYGRSNFQDVTVTDGRVTGTPFPVNQVASQLLLPGVNAPSNCAPRLDGKPVPAGTFCLPSGTSTCATDPGSVACKSCLLLSPAEQQAQGCKAQTTDDPEGDPVSLRCWDQKRRFGVDMLYPLQRYIDGLQNPTVYDRDGNKVPSPLFDDLPYRKALADGKPLARSKAPSREPRLVFFASITGVPWQDIARDPNDLSLGYRPVAASDPDPVSIDFELILGNPSGYNGEPRRDPTDPLMIESNVGDRREGKVHPITGETIGAASWNRINGRELSGLPDRLRLACVFDLPPGEDTGEFEGCHGGDAIEGLPAGASPLCEQRVSETDSAGNGQYDDPPRQYRAGATPGTRFLQVARELGGNAIVASICAPRLRQEDEGRDDFGYRPAIGAIVERLGSQLAAGCRPDDGAGCAGGTGGAVLDALIPGASRPARRP